MKGVNRYIKIILMVFQNRFLFAPNMAWWAQKWSIFMTLDLYKRSFFIFAQWMAKSYMKIVLMVFLKKLLFEGIGPFWTQKWDVFLILHSERGQDIMQVILMAFPKKNVLGQMGHFGHKLVSPLTVDKCG